jgi:methionyl aminopeptidase
MSITIKNAADITAMRVAGRLAGEVLDILTPHVRPGITTNELDRIAHDHMVQVQGCVPAPLNYAPPGYTPYPKSICTSVNHQVCHGIPNDRPLKNGDIVNSTSPSSRTAGTATPAACSWSAKARLPPSACARSPTRPCGRASSRCKPGARLGDIGHAIQTFAEGHGFSVVREFCGHGIGRKFHEEPQVLHYGRPGTGDRTGAGHDLHHRADDQRRQARHQGSRKPYDGWTIVTKDRSLSAQWEHTVLVTETGYEVLTLSAGSPPRPPFIPAKGTADARRR